MPEIKHQFTGGKMNKDLDERLVPNGEYRDAMNIQVSTSDGGDVGTVQNILGNIKISGTDMLSINAICVGSIADGKTDTLYWLVWDVGIDYIFSYKLPPTTGSPSQVIQTINAAEVIFRDVNKNVLKFDPDNIITGINVIDDMLFWTDNINEPKKINITRCKAGSVFSGTHTKLINEQQNIFLADSIDIEEKHITVIKKTPVNSLSMELIKVRNPNLIYTGIIAISSEEGLPHPSLDSYQGGTSNNSFATPDRHDFSGLTTRDGSNLFDIVIETGLTTEGLEQSLGNIGDSDGLTGWHGAPSIPYGQGKIPVGTRIVFKPFQTALFLLVYRLRRGF